MQRHHGINLTANGNDVIVEVPSCAGGIDSASGSGGAGHGETRGRNPALPEPDSFGGNSMEYLRIRNWDKWQTYRSDRGLPPWIKVHRQILRNPEWVSLTDAQRGQLLAIWILAADRCGEIPADPKVLKILCHLEHDPDIDLLIRLGFIDHGNVVASCWRQDGVTLASSCGIGVGSDEVQMKLSEGNVIEDNTCVVRIILKDGSYHNVTVADATRLKELYPYVDIEQQLRNIAGWNEANPAKRKTRAGITRHVNSWIARRQEQVASPMPHLEPEPPDAGPMPAGLLERLNEMAGR